MPVNNLKTISIITLLMLLLAPSMAAAAEADVAGKIAMVNDAVLLRPDLDREIQLFALKLSHQGRPMDSEQLKQYADKIRDSLIDRTVLLQQARTQGIQVKDSIVTKALDEFKASFKDEQEYQHALTEMGFTEATFNARVKDGLTVKALIDQAVIQKVVVSDKQVRSFYDQNPDLFRRPEQVRAAHILIQVPSDADEAKKAEALATIKALKQRIDNGEDFASLAMQHSDCPSKAKGGDLGFFSRDQMVAPFADAAFALQSGQVSDVVTTRFGYHLIRVIERRPAETLAFNDIKTVITKRLRAEQEGKKIADYLENLKKHAEIKRFPL